MESGVRASIGTGSAHGIRRAEEQWGTVISLDVRDVGTRLDERSVAEVVDACFAWFRRVDDLFSTWRPDTEIMCIGRGELRPDDASPEVREVLDLCEQMRLETHGAFDIRAGADPALSPRPGRAPVDPSGLVKGWAVARAGQMLGDAGARNFFVSAGGDLVADGHPQDGGAGWRVGVQHPWERDRVAAVLAVSDRAVATSGCYERGEHIIDPRSGRPAHGLASVTVVGPDLALADAYATATMVLGPDEGMRWLATRIGYEGMAIGDDRVVTTTPGLERYRV
jgi:thiamine biosynthesis lipoprotein